MIFLNKNFVYLFIFLILFSGFRVYAENYEAVSKASGVEVFFSPRSGSFVEGSTFEVPIILDTNGASVYGINIEVNFDHDRLLIVDPSGGKSIIGFWSAPPSYNNASGVVTYAGNMPEGIVTGSGLIGTITFKAIASGPAVVSVNASSKIHLNDGLQTSAPLDPGRAEYSILKKSPEGVNVFSETHPAEGKWYNNNNPVLSWQRDAGVTGFSFELDNKPFTVPDNVADLTGTTQAFENLGDGLWYFHIKALKNGAWGTTGHFLIKIDTVPPAEFKPETNNFLGSVITAGRTLVSFFTTDNLSGVDHYEVGTIDASQPISQAPVFIQTGSPYQVPILQNASLKVIVRALDKAGNVREGFVEVKPPGRIWKFFQSNLSLVLVAALIALFFVYKLLKAKNIINFGTSRTFRVLESDVTNYLNRRKELTAQDLSEKEKIESLEKDLEAAKHQIDQELHDIR